MRTTMLCAALVAQPAPAAVPFDALPLDQVAKLNGQRLTVTLAVGRLVYTWAVRGQMHTICGPDDTDNQERTVSLIGNRLAYLDEGAELRVTGVLRVIHHEEAVVGGVVVPAWAEIRFEE